jgi:membrane fusion protein (multidrug efflux system)
MRKIIPSIRLPHVFVVKEGLSLQDKILYEGIQRVKEGDRIIPETVTPEVKLSQPLN